MTYMTPGILEKIQDLTKTVEILDKRLEALERKVNAESNSVRYKASTKLWEEAIRREFGPLV